MFSEDALAARGGGGSPDPARDDVDGRSDVSRRAPSRSPVGPTNDGMTDAGSLFSTVEELPPLTLGPTARWEWKL